jgi:hypothetical protein
MRIRVGTEPGRRIMNINTNYVLLFTIVTLLVYLSLKAVYGIPADIDCKQNHVPCSASNSSQFREDLMQSLELWNAANCSMRDICTPINETGKMPP